MIREKILSTTLSILLSSSLLYSSAGYAEPIELDFSGEIMAESCHVKAVPNDINLGEFRAAMLEKQEVTRTILVTVDRCTIVSGSGTKFSATISRMADREEGESKKTVKLKDREIPLGAELGLRNKDGGQIPIHEDGSTKFSFGNWALPPKQTTFSFELYVKKEPSAPVIKAGKIDETLTMILYYH